MAGLLSTQELSDLQATVNSSLDRSITIKRASSTTDGTGHPGKSWPTLATVIGNLAQPTSSQMQNYGYLIGSLNAWHVRLPNGTDIKEDDRLVSGSQTMRVQAVLNPESYSISTGVLATEIEGEAL